jgi:hypothetical protein
VARCRVLEADSISEVFVLPSVRQLGANELEILRVRSVRMGNLNLNLNLNLLSRARASSNAELFAGVA